MSDRELLPTYWILRHSKNWWRAYNGFTLVYHFPSPGYALEKELMRDGVRTGWR